MNKGQLENLESHNVNPRIIDLLRADPFVLCGDFYTANNPDGVSQDDKEGRRISIIEDPTDECNPILFITSRNGNMILGDVCSRIAFDPPLNYITPLWTIINWYMTGEESNEAQTTEG